LLNLQPVLDARLWNAIESNFQSGDFTGAVVDSIHFLGELIRERSGLDGDGVGLVGEAFGGTNPKPKVNSLQTESERNVQRGIEQLLRGFYQGIRNPRSHQKYKDSSDDAEAIILFVNHLIKIIDRAKSPFDLASYLDRVFDPSFSDVDRYAELLIAEIPPGKRWDTLLAVYNEKEARGGQHQKKLSRFLKVFLKTLAPEELTDFCAAVSAELKTTNSDATVQTILQIMPGEYWTNYEEIARIRTESRLIASIKDGKYDRTRERCTAGAFGTWAVGLEPHFVTKAELLSVIGAKLASSDEEQQDYALHWFANRLSKIVDKPPAPLALVLRNGLRAGDSRFYNALSFLWDLLNAPPKWGEALGEAYDNFQKKDDVEPAATNVGISDEDVPF
jgi:uncharacterized protein (TIGR02391 family)